MFSFERLQGAFKKRDILSLTPCFSWVNEGRNVALAVSTVSPHFFGRWQMFLNSPCELLDVWQKAIAFAGMVCQLPAINFSVR